MASQSGDKCPVCQKAQMRTRTTNDCGDGTARRYIECPRCLHTVTVRVNAETIHRRKARVD